MADQQNCPYACCGMIDIAFGQRLVLAGPRVKLLSVANWTVPGCSSRKKVDDQPRRRGFLNVS